MLDLHRLAIWRAVVASGSVGGAAANLGYTAATISQHIIALQKSVGLRLYERRGRGIEPTAVGVRLADASADVFASARRFESLVEDLRTGPDPRLAIGCSSSAAKHWLPGVVAGVAQRFPDVQFEISMNEPSSGARRRMGDIEIVSEVPMEKPVELDGYRRTVLRHDDYVVIVDAAHRLAGADEVPMSELAEEPWIGDDIREGPTTRVSRLACNAAGFDPRYIARFDDHYAVLALVGSGIGVAVLPGMAASELPAGLSAMPIVDPVPSRRITMQVRESADHVETVRLAAELLLAQAGGEGG